MIENADFLFPINQLAYMLNETLLAKASKYKYFLATGDGQLKGTKRTLKFQEVIYY